MTFGRRGARGEHTRRGRDDARVRRGVEADREILDAERALDRDPVRAGDREYGRFILALEAGFRQEAADAEGRLGVLDELHMKRRPVGVELAGEVELIEVAPGEIATGILREPGADQHEACPKRIALVA